MPAPSSDVYDVIGRGYAARRRADPRIAAIIGRAVGDTTTVVNVGAGTGSYEPRRAGVVAVEPSAVMLAQRPPGAAPAVRARAEALPFGDDSFDVALGVLTIHHWTDQRRGLEECRRVARERVVVLTWDPDSDSFWLMRDYLPHLLAVDRGRFPTMEACRAVLGPIDVRTVLIPADCVDGFQGAFWRRPEAYLDREVRAGMSTFSGVGADEGLARLARDLDSGEWHRRYASLLERDELDIGYRLVVSGS